VNTKGKMRMGVTRKKKDYLSLFLILLVKITTKSIKHIVWQTSNVLLIP
jgi:hypothetical protein